MSSEYDSGCLFCQKEKGIKPLYGEPSCTKIGSSNPPPSPSHSLHQGTGMYYRSKLNSGLPPSPNS